MKRMVTTIAITLSAALVFLAVAAVMGTMMLVVDVKGDQNSLVHVMHNKKLRKPSSLSNSFYYSLLFADYEQVPKVIIRTKNGKIICETAYQTFPQAHLVTIQVEAGSCKRRTYSFPVG